MKNYSVSALRFIAITLVFLFHATVPGFSLGYLGVDIFLFISGVVLGPSLSQTSKNLNELFHFIVRRLMRLIPLLAVTLTFSFLILYSFAAPEYIDTMIQHFLASSLFVSNFILFSTTGYWSTSNDFNPFFHLWSLSLEIQLYLICGLVFFLGFKARALFWISLITLYLSILYNNNYNAFYLLPTYRMWEFAAGVYLANIHLKCRRSWLMLFISYLALLPSIFMIPEMSNHLITLSVASLFFMIFRLRPILQAKLSFFGSFEKHVYSFYLIHIPVFTLANYVSLTKLGWYAYFYLFPIIVVLSLIIDSKVNLTNTSKIIRIRIFVLFGVVLLSLSTLYASELYYKTLYSNDTISRNDGQILNSLPRKYSFNPRNINSDTILFVGDSFARDLFNLTEAGNLPDVLAYYENLNKSCDSEKIIGLLQSKFVIFTRRETPINCYEKIIGISKQLGKRNFVFIGSKSFGENANRHYSLFPLPKSHDIKASEKTIQKIRQSDKRLQDFFINLYEIIEPSKEFSMVSRDKDGNAITFDLIHFSSSGVDYYSNSFTLWLIEYMKEKLSNEPL